MPVLQIGHVPPDGRRSVAVLDSASTRRAFRAGVDAVAAHFVTHSDPLGYTISIVPVFPQVVAVQLFDHTGALEAYRWVALVRAGQHVGP